MRSWNYFLLLGILLLQGMFLSSTLASTQPLRVLDEFSNLGGTGFENEHNLLLDEEAHVLYGVNEWDNIFFRINLLAEQPKMEILYQFSRKNKIFLPKSKLIFSKDKKYIYGIADEAVYRINLHNPENVSVTLLHEFAPNDSVNGHHPIYSVALSPDEKYLYGITNSESLSISHTGTIFRIDLMKDNFPFTTLYKFNDNLNGIRPVQLVINREGTSLYGTTSYGGKNDCGTIFQYNLIDTMDKTFTVLDNFKTCGRFNNHYESIDLILSHDNKFLYGVHGGIFENGMRSYVYRLPLYNTSSLEILYLFDKSENDENIFGPASSLALNENDSILYGTSSWTSLGGHNSCGTLFAQDLTNLKKNPAENKLLNLYAFECYVKGNAPQGILLNHNSKKLYGTTIWGGKNNHGIIFEFSNIRE